MVHKKSEYRRKYRDPSWDSHFQHYKEKLDYRISRRRLEHHHENIDWEWDSENESDGHTQQRLPSHPINSSDTRRKSADCHHDNRPPGRSESGDHRQPMINEDFHHTEHKGTVSGPEIKQPAKHSKTKKKPSGNGRKQARPSSSPSKMRSATGPPLSHDYPPMIAFGWADQEIETGSKRTHNIRASADPLQIYPSALRALRRRELDMQRDRAKDKQAWATRDQKLRAMFNVQPSEDSIWLTEYRRNFSGPSQPG